MKLGENIKINCHSSICIDGDIYFDPFKIERRQQPAKIIFITHPHFDHLDLESIDNIISPDTVIVCSTPCKEKLPYKNKIIA